MEKFCKLLGLKVTDKVTGFSGIVTSVSFDLYGCVQALVNPGLIEDKLGEQTWFDCNRLKVLNKKPVMDQPNFNNVPGAAEKPRCTVS